MKNTKHKIFSYSGAWHQSEYEIVLFLEIQPDFELSFENSPSTETLDYVLLDGFTKDLNEVNKLTWCISRGW